VQSINFFKNYFFETNFYARRSLLAPSCRQIACFMDKQIFIPRSITKRSGSFFPGSDTAVISGTRLSIQTFSENSYQHRSTIFLALLAMIFRPLFGMAMHWMMPTLTPFSFLLIAVKLGSVPILLLFSLMLVLQLFFVRFMMLETKRPSLELIGHGWHFSNNFLFIFNKIR
jgi:hypothetical protein